MWEKRGQNCESELEDQWRLENSQYIQRRRRDNRINELPDELLLKILSWLPNSDVGATSVLSKRWRSLWTEVKTCRFDIAYFTRGRRSFYRFTQFISRRSRVESLHLRLITTIMPIKPLLKDALNRSLRELRIDMVYYSLELPEILYHSQLETLILEKLSMVDVPSNVSLTCLKTLHLISVKLGSDGSVKRLLSICPRLKDLVVKQSSYTNAMIFTINVPTLTSLSIYTSSRPKGGVHGFVIDTPSLKRFSMRDSFSNYLRFENMPNLVKASVNIVSDKPDSLSSHLEILVWRQYNGTEQERKAATHILANASRLKRASFYSEKDGMLKELECAARGSKTCQLNCLCVNAYKCISL